MQSPKGIEGNFLGIYRAYVASNVDPLGIGRIKVRIPLIHGTSEVEGANLDALPYASLCSAFGGGSNFGSFMVPEVGEFGFVMFEDGDSNKPVWLGSTYGTDGSYDKEYGNKEKGVIWKGVAGTNEVPIEAQRAYPTQKVIYKSHYGSKIYIDTEQTSEKIGVEDEFGQKLEISSFNNGRYIDLTDNNGVHLHIENGQINVGVTGKTGITITPSSDSIVCKAGDSIIDMASSGQITIKPHNRLNIEATHVKIKSTSNIDLDGNVNINGNTNIKGSLKVKGKIRRY